MGLAIHQFLIVALVDGIEKGFSVPKLFSQMVEDCLATGTSTLMGTCPVTSCVTSCTLRGWLFTSPQRGRNSALKIWTDRLRGIASLRSCKIVVSERHVGTPQARNPTEQDGCSMQQSWGDRSMEAWNS